MGNRKVVAIEEQDGKRYLAFGPYLFSTSASEWRYAVYYYLRWWTPYTLLWIVRKFWSWSVRWPLWYAEMMLDRGKPFINRLQLRADGIEHRLAWCCVTRRHGLEINDCHELKRIKATELGDTGALDFQRVARLQRDV